ncbi:MAG: hypothetical protein P1U82_08365, partial [Verrucomicrobiales bacterium]|nr:hypothetical protein [Verrucomicrobiales bacterium]
MNSFHRHYLAGWAVSMLVATITVPAFGALKISEFQAKNLASLDDEQLASSDWVEIRNEGGSEVDLQGYYLTDDPENLDKWV